jgi:D-serine deaminase-like pyridoxal phosphate-dependent protein
VVAKSLPAPGLLSAILTGMGTQRLMVFSAEMLRQLMTLHPQADYLGGKPLPVSEFIRISSDAASDPGPRMQWLIDTPQRLREYAEAAKARGITLRASLEIDVGLHRGGFADPQALAEAVTFAKAAGVEIAGLMGYDPHVPKMPSPDSAWADAQGAIRQGHRSAQRRRVRSRQADSKRRRQPNLPPPLQGHRRQRSLGRLGLRQAGGLSTTMT